MPLLLEELKERIALVYDVCLICDVLDIEPEEILDRFEDKLIDNLKMFEDVDED
jgi:hypothetical protein